MRMSTKHRLAAALFLLLIFAPMAAQLLSGGATVSTIERRALASFPAFADAAAAPAQFPGRLSAWMEDHMGLRAPLTRLYTKVTDELDLSSSRFAVRGDDGWLFLALDDALASHQGLTPFAPGEAQAFVDGAELMVEAACGKPFAILIAPDKHTIYGEYLSTYPRRSARPTRLETLAGAAPAAGLSLAAPVDALLSAKEKAQVYYKTDSHWTARGAYEGYRALMDALMKAGLDAAVVAESRVIAAGETQHKGDLYGLLGIENAAPEPATRWIIEDGAKTLREESIPDYDWGDFPSMRWTSSENDAPRLVVFGDSYFYGLKPFLENSFSSVTFIHHRLGKAPLAALASCDFDAVALEMVERHLNHGLVPVR